MTGVQTCALPISPNRPAIPLEDEVLWTLFERDFRNAFTDSQKQLTAHQKFLKVKMQGNALDEFIAEFEHLHSEAGWSSNDIGTITQFRCSLNTGLLKAIVQHVRPRLCTLHKWFNAAREQHDIWNELKATIEDAKSTGPPTPPRRSTTYMRPSNAMDVDAVRVNALAAEEKDRLCYAQALGVVDGGSLSVELSGRIRVCSGRPSCRAFQGQNHGVRRGYRDSGEVRQSA